MGDLVEVAGVTATCKQLNVRTTILMTSTAIWCRSERSGLQEAIPQLHANSSGARLHVGIGYADSINDAKR